MVVRLSMLVIAMVLALGFPMVSLAGVEASSSVDNGVQTSSSATTQTDNMDRSYGLSELQKQTV
jgi:hypothetical protein